jgi:hypothetical protein
VLATPSPASIATKERTVIGIGLADCGKMVYNLTSNSRFGNFGSSASKTNLAPSVYGGAASKTGIAAI